MEDCLTKLYQSQSSIDLCGKMERDGEEYIAVYLKVCSLYTEGVLALDDKYDVDTKRNVEGRHLGLSKLGFYTATDRLTVE